MLARAQLVQQEGQQLVSEQPRLLEEQEAQETEPEQTQQVEVEAREAFGAQEEREALETVPIRATKHTEEEAHRETILVQPTMEHQEAALPEEQAA